MSHFRNVLSLYTAQFFLYVTFGTNSIALSFEKDTLYISSKSFYFFCQCLSFYLCLLAFEMVGSYFFIVGVYSNIPRQSPCMCQTYMARNMALILFLTLYSHYAEDGVFQLDGMETLPPPSHRWVDVQTREGRAREMKKGGSESNTWQHIYSNMYETTVNAHITFIISTCIILFVVSHGWYLCCCTNSAL